MNQRFRHLGLSALVIIIMLGIVVSVVNIAPQSGSAAPGNRRDLSSPLSRLAGYWASTCGHGGIYYARIDLHAKSGYVQMCDHANAGGIGRPLVFKVQSEEPTNNRVVIRFHGQIDALSNLSHRIGMRRATRRDTVVTVSRDGQTMTEECVHEGEPVCKTYCYVGPSIPF